MKTPTRHAVVLSAVAVASTFVVVAGPASAAGCHPDANDLRVTYQPVDHTITDANYFRARLTVANADGRCSLGGGWTMTFNSVRRPTAVLDGAAGDVGRQLLASQGLAVDYADRARSGDFYALRPASGFKPIAPGERRSVDINIELWATHKTDAPQGWAIAFGSGRPNWVRGKALHDPTDPKQTKAFSGDVRPVQNADRRFAENTSSQVDLALKQRIVPQPQSATAEPGTVTIGEGSPVNASPALRGEAGYLKSALRDVSRGHGAPISLSTDSGLDVDRDGKADAEGYTLRSSADGVRIVGRDRAGVLYGIQTLRQLIPAEAYQAAAAGRAGAVRVPRASIADAPLFTHRGLHIDTARHFESVETVKKFLDLMSFTKLNRLHLGVTNDEGFRLEIPGLPELTEFGARRAHDTAEKNAMHQGMGSVNDLGRGDGIDGKPGDRTEANLGRRPAFQGFEQATANFVGKGSGYYSVRDYKDILTYARDRHIEVFPEINLPAHARAAVQSMERRYQRTGDDTYRLLDPKDASRHTSVQNYNDNLANPCIPSTYRFLTKVTTEVKKMYDSVGVPLNRIHLGGDEPPGAPEGWWNGSPACQNNPETKGKSGEELADLFFGRWNEIALKVAPATSGWEDIQDPNRKLRLPKFAPYPWQNVAGWGREDWAYKYANEGTPVILAHATNLYADLAYNKDPDEPGYYWAQYVDEKSTFTYQPFNVFANLTEDRFGNPFTPDPNQERLTEAGKKNILGMEMQLWAENGKAPEIREYQAFPKMLGAAERAWNRQIPTPAQMPAAWNVFNNTLGQVTFPLLSFYRPVGLRDSGVNYRVPLPGGRISGGVLTANVRNPGLAIEYSTDGRSWSTYRGPARVGDSALTRTRSADGRVSRISPVNVPAWQQGTAYKEGALVTHQGEIFRAARASGGQAPDVSPRSWSLLQ